MKQSLIVISIIAVIALIGGAIGYQLNQPPEQSNLSGQANAGPIDLIGTKIGTSTTGVGFSITSTGGQSATTTYPYEIGNETDLAIIDLQIKAASSSAANIAFSLLGSNDTDCDTASTTTSYANIVLTGDVNWFDISDHLKGKVHTNPSWANATSSLSWINPSAGLGREIILEDLNHKCIALSVSGSSTLLRAELRTKNLAK